MTRLLTLGCGGAGVATAGDPSWSSVKLLMGFEGADNSTGTPGMDDESSAAHGTATTVSGNAHIETTSPLVGTSSLDLDGSGDGIAFTAHADWGLGSTWTIDVTWLPGATTSDMCLLAVWQGTGISGYMLRTQPSSALQFFLYDGGTFNIQIDTAASAFSVGVQQTIRVDASGGVVRLYIDGTMAGSDTDASTAAGNSITPLGIGWDGLSGRYLQGKIDEVRITKGVARTASNGGYTPETLPYPRS